MAAKMMWVIVDDGYRRPAGLQVAIVVAGIAALLWVPGLGHDARRAPSPTARTGQPDLPARTGPVMGWDTRCVPAVPPPGRCEPEGTSP